MPGGLRVAVAASRLLLFRSSRFRSPPVHDEFLKILVERKSGEPVSIAESTGGCLPIRNTKGSIGRTGRAK
ncbi:MAG: hypothetical protein V1787_06555 [Candidatus Micrarchaeota archaeon]